MIELIVVGILLILSGVFSGTEVAYTSLTVDQVERLRKSNGRAAQMAATLHDRLDVVLTTITIGNNLANLIASALVSALTIRYFGEVWLGASTGALTLVVLVFGEVTPKQIGIARNEAIARALAMPLRVLSLVFMPAVWLIRHIAGFITRLTGSTRSSRLSAEGLRHLVLYAGASGIVHESEARLMRNVLRSSDVQVEAVMTHRTRVFSLDASLTLAEAMPRIAERRFSRFPIYDTDQESIVGVIVMKNVMDSIVQGNWDVRLSDLAEQPLFVPTQRTIRELWNQFLARKLNMAVVLDEYGGVAGVVTREDVIEEILGEIYDEGEQVDHAKLLRLPSGEYELDADTPIHVVNDTIDVAIPNGDVQSVGGYLLRVVGRVPRKGESIETPVGTFHIDLATQRRLLRLRFVPASDTGDPP